MHIQNFVALAGDWTALVNPELAEDGDLIQVAVAGVGLIDRQWVVCAITGEGAVKPVSEWGEIRDVIAGDVDDEDDDE